MKARSKRVSSVATSLLKGLEVSVADSLGQPVLTWRAHRLTAAAFCQRKLQEIS